MLATLIAAITAFAATPQLAASHIYFPKAPIVVRTVSIGSYATVVTRGGRIEGSPNSTPVLVERFPFGWQPIALVGPSCDLRARGLTLAQSRKLGLGAASMIHDRTCDDIEPDTGSPADVAAVRRAASGPLVPFVKVSGVFAVSEWYGGGGGMDLYKKTGGAWTRIGGGGGSMGASDAMAKGVPASGVCALGFTDGPCSAHVSR